MSQRREKTKKFWATKMGVLKAIKKAGFSRLSTKEQTRYYRNEEGQTVIYFFHPENKAIGAMLRYSNDIQFGLKLFLGTTFNTEVIPMVEVKLNHAGQVKDRPNQLSTVVQVEEKINHAIYRLYEVISMLKNKAIDTQIAAKTFNAADTALNTGNTRQISRLRSIAADNALKQLATVYAHYTVDGLGTKESGREWSMKRNGRYAPCTEIRKIEKLALAITSYLLRA